MNMSTSKKEVKLVLGMNITPKKAKEFLAKKYLGNLTPSNALVNHLAKEMKEGKWKLNGNTIKISDKNVLLDGRHRLLAVVKSGVTIKMDVHYGMSGGLYISTPTRNPNDILDIKRTIEISKITSRVKPSMNKFIESYTKTSIRRVVGTKKFEDLEKGLNKLGYTMFPSNHVFKGRIRTAGDILEIK